jgi:hypothetical protein
MSLLAVCAWLLASAASAMPDQQACPKGWVRVTTRDPNEPFHCRRQMDPSTPFIEMTPEYKVKRCPKGFRPIDTPGEMQRFRCVADDTKPSGDPDTLQIEGPKKQEKASSSASAPAVLEYVRYTMPNIMQFEYPKGWQMTDGWSDEVPTLYIEYDTGRQGKQPTIVVTKYAQGQEGWVDLDTAVSQEKEYQNAKELPSIVVGGRPARVTTVERQSRSAYVAVAREEYYLLSYSGPEDLFSVYEPAFKRLTSTFRVSRRAAK